MAHYILNSVPGDGASERLRTGTWGVDADEPHREALAAGDLVLVYLGAPRWEFVGRAELASAARGSGLLLERTEEFDPPVPMDVVLARLDSPLARADFEAGVVEITAHEYETVLAVAAERGA